MLVPPGLFVTAPPVGLFVTAPPVGLFVTAPPVGLFVTAATVALFVGAAPVALGIAAPAPMVVCLSDFAGLNRCRSDEATVTLPEAAEQPGVPGPVGQPQ